MLQINSTPQGVASTLYEKTGDTIIDVGTDMNDLVTGQSVVLSCYVESSSQAHVQFFKDGVIVEHHKLVTLFQRTDVVEMAMLCGITGQRNLHTFIVSYSIRCRHIPLRGEQHGERTDKRVPHHRFS